MLIRTRPSPNDVAMVDWTVTHSGAGLSSLASAFYKHFYDPTQGLELTPLGQFERRQRFGRRLEQIERSLAPPIEVPGFDRTDTARGFRLHDLVSLGPSLRAALETAFGDQWTAEVQDAWTLAYNLGAAALLAAGADLIPHTALRKSA